MAKFIIDTDEMATELSLLVAHSRPEYLLYALRNAHTGKQVALWLTPYQEKKTRAASGTGPYSEEFETFWAAYPASNGKKSGKRQAFKSWCKAAGHDLVAGTINKFLAVCLEALEWQKRHEDWTKDKGTFIPHASTYLNGERWADERPEGLSEAKIFTDMDGRVIEQ